MEANRLGRKRTLALVLVATLVMVLSAALSVVAGAASLPSHAAPSTNAASTVPAATAAPAAAPAATAAVPVSPNPGTLNVYLDASGGAGTVDPAIAYYTVDYEPIANVYGTLIQYNGTGTGNFVPVDATCVPGTPQCTTDYGAPTSTIPGFTGIFNQAGQVFTGSNGLPIYWTFVIDPAAHFYNGTNNVGWPVYPSDVVFSLARTAAAADLPGVAANPGWIQTQALVPITNNPKWDGGMHAPFNNTPYDVLSSMLVNNSSFCPQTAMNGVMGHGCITFNASGEASSWPEFLEFMVDNLGASIVPCGWATSVGAGVPGFTGTLAPNGDGSCLLPGGTNNTSSAAFQAYLASVANNTRGEYSWDAFENLSTGAQNFQPVIKSTMVGSGPYWGSVSLATGYGLEASPVYEQPSGCGGDPAHFAQYTGYCDPAADPAGPYNPATFGYIPVVHVHWESSDSIGLADYQAGTADFADISPNHVAEMLALQAESKINIVAASSINIFQQSYDLFWNASTRSSEGFSGANNIPENFFAYQAARSLLSMAYPTATIESQVWTTDGLQTFVPVGSPIPPGLGCYAPDSLTGGCDNTYTVPFQDTTNGGNVNTDASTPGSAAWWWAQGTNPTSPYYDPELAACTPTSPCYFSIEGATGAPAQDAANALWIQSIESITGNALQPNAPDISADDLLSDCGIAASYTSICPVFNFGWIADYPDPTDYMGAYGYASASYTTPATQWGELGAANLPKSPNVFNNTTLCAAAVTGGGTHTNGSFANLTFWSNWLNASTSSAAPGTIPNACQGAVYSNFLWAISTAAPLAAGTTLSSERVLLYDLSQTLGNALEFYTWTGQQNVYQTAATWIDPASINENPTIGTGDVQLWYMIQYAKAVVTTNETFEESGLAKGTAWQVAVNGENYASTSTKLVIALPTGTYTYKVIGSDAYAPLPLEATGSLTVTATPTIVKIKFANVGSEVTFTESGIKKNADLLWYVQEGPNYLNGTNQTKVSERLSNGSYSWYAVVPAGYYATPQSGHFTVLSPKGVTVKIAIKPYDFFSVTFNPTGITGGWSVALKLVKGTGLLAAKPGSAKSATNGPISWTDLANGTYTYTAVAKGFTTVTGTLTIGPWLPWSVGLPTSDTTTSVTTGTVGMVAETGTAVFTVPVGYQIVPGDTVAGLAFNQTSRQYPGQASGNVSVAPAIVNENVVEHNASVWWNYVNFTYTYNVSLAGTITLIGATLYNNASVHPPVTVAFVPKSSPAGLMWTPAAASNMMAPTATRSRALE